MAMKKKNRKPDHEKTLAHVKDYLAFILVHGALSVAIAYLTITRAIALSGYGYSYVKLVFGVLLWILIDNTLLRRVPTFRLIVKEGNIAVAIIFLGFALIIAGALAGS